MLLNVQKNSEDWHKIKNILNSFIFKWNQSQNEKKKQIFYLLGTKEIQTKNSR